MKRKFVRGMAAGALIGAAAGMLFMPEMNGNSKKRLGGAAKKITGFTSNLWDQITDFRK